MSQKAFICLHRALKPMHETQTGSTQRRNKSRGGLGKYLRASGRGRGRGRGAAFTERVVLDDEETIELTEEEAQTLEVSQIFVGL
jgi:hypothetical protein